MATRERKPKPTAVKELEGNPGKRKLNENEPKPEKKAPACPKWLLPEAKKEWRRLAKSMETRERLMMTKTVKVGEKEVSFKISASIPRMYRILFKRDIFKDLSKLEKSYQDKEGGGGDMPIEDLEIFENVAYCMAKHADPTIPGTIDEWLDQFDMFSIYEVLPEILELWGNNPFPDPSWSSAPQPGRQQPDPADRGLLPQGGGSLPQGRVQRSHLRPGASGHRQ